VTESSQDAPHHHHQQQQQQQSNAMADYVRLSIDAKGARTSVCMFLDFYCTDCTVEIIIGNESVPIQYYWHSTGLVISSDKM